MSEYVVSSDNIDGREQSRIDALCSALEKKGHTCTKRGVGPNTIQSYGLGSQASGKIGVFIVGGSDAGMYVDFVTGLKKGYYHYKHMWVVFASDTATTDKWITCNGLKNTALVRAWDDNYSGSNIEAVGKTAKAYFDANKEYIHYACGKLGCKFEDVIQNFLSGNGGGDDSDEGGSSASSIKDAMKEVMSFWDGEVECYVRDNKCYIHHIQDPEENCDLLLAEGVNLATDSLTITDYNPDTVNFLTVHWQGGEDIIFRDESLIARFGEKPLELDAVKRILTTTTKEKTVTDTSDSETESDTEETTTTTETTVETTTEEVPVETYEEALTFANIEWAKIKRDDGHTVECKTVGSEKWQVGLWCRVYAPSWNLDQYMYITRVSQSESDGWECGISLADYPPSFGEYKEESSEDEEEIEEDVDVDVEVEE